MESAAVSPRLTGLLGFNAGYVDTAGFLALHGLFAAHVTGNFVTLGASMVHGTTGAWAKLAALPVFCTCVLATRIASTKMQARGQSAVMALLLVKTMALLVAAGVLIVQGPFLNGDTWPAFTAGMLLVGAMAIQNAVQRMHFSSAPPSTLMTGTTTQVMMDLGDLLLGASGEARAAAQKRLHKMLPAMATFAMGCALAALAYISLGMWCFAFPPLAAAVTVVLSLERSAFST